MSYIRTFKATDSGSAAALAYLYLLRVVFNYLVINDVVFFTFELLLVPVAVHALRGSSPVVARNYIFSLIWRCYGPKRDILDYWGTILYCLLSYYILSKDKGL